tara:strand:+ start:79 stop:270 length:192 start_codon:yes stop_codon:yes gene_type:complete
MDEVREYVRLVLEERQRQAAEPDDDLLVEPDETEDSDEEVEENPLATIATVMQIAAAGKALIG